MANCVLNVSPAFSLRDERQPLIVPGMF